MGPTVPNPVLSHTCLQLPIRSHVPLYLLPVSVLSSFPRPTQAPPVPWSPGSPALLPLPVNAGPHGILLLEFSLPQLIPSVVLPHCLEKQPGAQPGASGHRVHRLLAYHQHCQMHMECSCVPAALSMLLCFTVVLPGLSISHIQTTIL